LAVISVVLFHAEPNVFKLGFLGVDAFFVISGFVITPLMVASIENRSSIKHPVLDFYRKRIYRLAPAFGVTIMVSILLIFYWETSKIMRDFSSRALVRFYWLGISLRQN
jgi:peptidoglycan/LPS O-acetylase OafA/YrhL